MGVLTVYLDKVTNLRDEDGMGKSDPYIKFELEQDNMVFDKGYGKQESTKKSGELNPEYGETFEFNDVTTLNNMVLHIMVMDDDIGRDDKIGSAKINLEHMGLSETPQDVEVVVDKKDAKGSICHPCKWLCACCLACCKSDAKIYLKLSYTE